MTARAVLPVQSGIPTPVVKERDLSLPGISEISSFFASISSDLTPQSTGTAGTGSMSGSGLLGDLESFITDVFGNVTNAAGTEVVNVINTLVGDVVSTLGVKQWYALYITEYCEGYYEPSYSTPGAKMNATSCTQLSESSPFRTNDLLTAQTIYQPTKRTPPSNSATPSSTSPLSTFPTNLTKQAANSAP